jgi:hypothetical protein
MNKLNEKQANEIYDILVQECGAFERDRPHFVYCQTNEEIPEWRFCGKLGFGGKFWRNDDRLYVNCYRESETPANLEMIIRANLPEVWNVVE